MPTQLTHGNLNVYQNNDQKESRLKIVQTMLNIFSVTISKQDFLDDVVNLIRCYSQCRCVGIRVLDSGGNIPYDSYTGFSREFWEAENEINIMRDDCVCIRVVKGQPCACDMPVINKAGSFVCNDIEAFVRSLSGEAENLYRGVCAENGFLSVAVIPIRSRDSILGAIHLADPDKNKLDADMVEFLESVAPLIGEFLSHDSLEKALKNCQGNLYAELTRREQAEQALRKSQKDLQSMLDNIPDVISRFDKNHCYLYTNAAIKTITERSREYLFGRSHKELGKKEVFPIWDKYLRQVFETGEEAVWEFDYDHGAGKRYYQVRFTPEFDDNQNVVSVLTVNRDITDSVLLQKQKEEVLEAENRMFIAGPIVAFRRRGGLDGKLEYGSPNALEQFGYDPQLFVSGELQYIDFIHPEDREYWKTHRESITVEDPFAEMEYRIRRIDGEWRWIYEYIIPIKDNAGLLEGYQGYLFDITDRKRSEIMIADSERKYRELVEAANVIIMDLDETGQIMFINDFGLKFFGYEFSALINHSLRGTVLPHFDSAGRDQWSGFERIFANRTHHDRRVAECVRKDGRRVWIEWTNRFSEDPETGAARLLTVGVDITARRRAEAAIKFHYERERRIKLLNDTAEGRIGQDEFSRLAEPAGIHLSPPFVCSVVSFDFSSRKLSFLLEDREEWRAWMETAVDLINAHLGGTAWLVDNGIAILEHVPERSNQRRATYLDEWVGRLTEILKDVFRGVDYIVGISSVQREIPALYRQAQLAAYFGPVFRPGSSVIHWRELGLGQFIVEQAHTDNGRAFVQEWLGPLCGEPTTRNAELLETLAAIIAGDNLLETANRLHIHPKTLAFRKRKIEQIIRRKLDEPEARMNIAVALKLLNLQAKPPVL